MLGYTFNSQSIVDLEDNHQPLINLGAFWLLAVECDSRSKYENFKSKPPMTCPSLLFAEKSPHESYRYNEKTLLICLIFHRRLADLVLGFY
jgi:hypothetical protein